MTKKRSKTAIKKKQAAAKKKKVQSKNKLFGLASSESSATDHVVRTTTSTQKSTSRTRKRRRRATDATEKQQQQQQQTTDESADFDRQMASLQERRALGSSSNNKQSRRSAGVSIQAATFVVDDSDKPTSRLIEEATAHVDTLLDATTATHHRTRRGDTSHIYELQALAAKQHRGVAQHHDSTTSCRNPFAALEMDDDSEEEYFKAKETRPTKPLFRFAPASFTVPGETSNTVRSGENDQDDDDIDPDL